MSTDVADFTRAAQSLVRSNDLRAERTAAAVARADDRRVWRRLLDAAYGLDDDCQGRPDPADFLLEVLTELTSAATAPVTAAQLEAALDRVAAS